MSTRRWLCLFAFAGAAALTGALGLANLPLQAQAPAAPSKAPAAATHAVSIPIASMSELMVDLIYPTSNDLFYIFRDPPKTPVEWNKVKLTALTLAESANLLMAPERRFDDEDWMDDAKLLLDVGRKAYIAAKANDQAALEALSDELNTACIQCHQDYRANYRRRTPAKAEAK